MMILSVLGVLTFAARSEAQLWTTAIGSGCIPDAATVKAQLYENLGFGVGFTTNATGTLRFYCPWPMQSSGGKLDGMFMTYMDADGPVTANHVVATMQYAGMGSNGWTTLGTCDSNSSIAIGPNQLTCGFPVHTMSYNNFYWWLITITRTSASTAEQFYSITPAYHP